MTVKSINKVSLKQKLKNLIRHPASLIMFLITWGAALITIAVVIFLVAYILIKGVPNIKPSLNSAYIWTERVLPECIRSLGIPATVPDV